MHVYDLPAKSVHVYDLSAVCVHFCMHVCGCVCVCIFVRVYNPTTVFACVHVHAYVCA